MDNEKLRELIVAITAERDTVIQQANQQIAYFNGKIDALKELAEQGDKDNETRE